MGKSHRNALQPGYRVQWYEIAGVLGQGGFGITYLAKDTNLDQQVAIKEYLPFELAARDTDQTVHPLTDNLAEDYAWGLERFISEARTLARFDHPNIVRVLTVFEANNTAYMVMRFEQGRPLSEVLDDEELPEGQLLAVALALIDGLEHVHAAGFIHRDIKPANIYIRADGSPVLLDFGSARQALGVHTHTLTTLVSPGYAPYEQYMSNTAEQGPWTDIYALGATLYRAACGVAPMTAIDRSKPILHGSGDFLVSATEIAANRYSPGLLAAIDHALAFREADRPQTLAAWREELLGQAPVSLPAARDPVSAAYDKADGREATTRTALMPDTTPSQGEQPQQRKQWRWRLPILLLACCLLPFIVVPVALKILLAPGTEAETAGAVTPPAELRVAPLPAAVPPDDRPARIRDLLREAGEDIEALRLTTPAGENAYDKYQRVLALDPGNVEARDGLSNITLRYLELARDAARAADWPRLRALLDKAHTVNPDDPRLIEVEARLDELFRRHAARPGAGGR